MSSFANAPQNQTFSFGPPTTTTQNQPGNYTTIVNQRMGGGLGGYGSMGGYGGATGAPFNLSAANPMGAGLGGFGGFGGMGGYGFNPMMGGGFGGFGGMGGYGFNPMMGGGFGGFGYNPMMGGGFGGFGYNPMMGMGLGSFGGFGGFNPMMGGVNPPRGITPSEPIPDPNDNFTVSTQALIPATRDGVSGYYTDGSMRNFVPYSQTATPTVEDAIISDETGQYDPNRGRQTEQLIQPISSQAQAQMQLLNLLRQQQLLGRLGGFDPSMQAQQQQQELLRNSGLTQTRSGLSSENSNDPRMLELDRRRQEKLERDRARGYSLDAEYQYSPEQLAEIDRNFRLSKLQGGP